MKRLLSLSLSLILLSACSDNSSNSPVKSDKYTRVKNEYWKNCKYKDVIREVLTQRLDHRLHRSDMSIDDISKQFKDKYDPEYTSTAVLQTLEVEIGQFISSLARRDDVKEVKKDSIPLVPLVPSDTIKTVIDSIKL